MGDLATEALVTFRAKELERKQAEAAAREEANRSLIARTHASIARCRMWAEPILNDMFGERKWIYVNPGARCVEVYIDTRRSKTLMVADDGAITGRFQVSPAGGRYSNVQPRYSTVRILNLEHLGALLDKERECFDTEMRNSAD